MLDTLTIPQEQIRTFCQRHHIRWLALFGSVLDDRFDEDSDLDVLVTFEPGHVPGWEFITMQDELSRLFGRPVDLNTPGFLSETFRDEVLRQATVLVGSSAPIAKRSASF